MKTSEAAFVALGGIVAANVAFFLRRDDFSPWPNSHTVYGISLSSVATSMFHHADASHLVVNMICLWRYGNEVFVRTSSRVWSAPIVIVCLYFACGILASYGTLLLSCLYEKQWQRRLQEMREAVSCSHWLCQTTAYGTVTQPMADLFTYANHSSEAAALWRFKLSRRLGASGAVYGLLGLRIVTSVLSPFHRRLSHLDVVLIAAQVAQEISEIPFSLSSLSMKWADGVDHACHLFGLVSGASLGIFLHYYTQSSKNWRGEGVRLGSE
mmetsp:Transcript_60655/g.179863  ORF Transcript_60655/g.179863 Transcript_60655/m.179863 type:complete len:268 (-) Transcript_60655:1173-1976(-)